MSDNKFGDFLRERRTAFGLSQRGLAEKVGVQSSHIAYLEGGQRKPSMNLAIKIAKVLRVNERKLWLLVHPDHLRVLAPSKREPRVRNAWKEFRNNRELLRQYHVTPQELALLEQVNLTGPVPSPIRFLAVLFAIRSAQSPD